jgi:hypothetical protein
VGETLAPSVRRQLRPILATVLASTGLLANLPLLALAFLFRRVAGDWALSSSWVGGVVIAAALLDGVLTLRGRPSPPAVRSQVPQWWGHRFGPWWGSARYGLRLGLGPATMLNSWLWWAGLVITLDSPWSLLLGFTVFVMVRTLTMFAVSWGVPSGPEMAKRAKLLDAATKPVRYAVAFLALCGAVLAWAFTS